MYATLQDALQDSLSPKAIVAIAAHLQPAKTRDIGVNAEIRWIEKLLRDMIGNDEFNAIADEIGV